MCFSGRASPKIKLKDRHPQELTLEQFQTKYRHVDLAKFMEEAKPFTTFRGEVLGALAVVHEAGIIMVNGQPVEWRHSVRGAPGGDEIGASGCVGIGFKGKNSVGILGEGTLAIFKGPIPHSFIEVVRDKHYFLRYTDLILEKLKTPVPTWRVVIYFLKQEDGTIVYQGKVDRDTYPDPNLRLTDIEFCSDLTDSGSH